MKDIFDTILIKKKKKKKERMMMCSEESNRTHQRDGHARAYGREGLRDCRWKLRGEVLSPGGRFRKSP